MNDSMQQEIRAMQSKNQVGRMINFRPIFTFALFLLAGVLYAYFRILEGKNAYVLSFAAFLLPLVALCFTRRKLRVAIYIAVFYLAFAVGNASFAWTVDAYRSQPKYAGEYTIEGTVVDKSYTDYGGELLLTNLSIGGNHQTGKMTVSVSDADFAAFKHCDRVRMRLTVRSVNVLEGNYGFRAEGIADQELYSGSLVSEYSVVGTDFDLGVFLRGALQTTITQSMQEEGAALLTAILLGNTSGIEKGLLENIRYGGIAHVFAVSGLHIGSMFAVCLMLFRRRRIPAPIRFLLSAFVLLFYGSVCGYSASVVRSIVTCLTLYGCSLLGLKYDSLESLSLAFSIVLLLYPTLLFGVGAQLSFGACLGILLLSRPLRNAFERLFLSADAFFRYRVFRNPKPEPVDMFRMNTSPTPLMRQWLTKAAAFISVTLSAQIATVPILYNAFGYFSVVSILFNCIFVPLISLGFAPLLAIATLAACFPPSFGTVVLYLPDLVLHVSVLPFHVLELSSGILRGNPLSAEAVALYYGGVLLASDKLNLPKWHRRGLVTVYMLAVAVCIFAALS
jgi:ComEC/Rec2-related protein